MSKTAKAYVNRILTSAQNRGVSKEGMCGYLSNVLFQLKRKEEKQKVKLAITGDEIAAIAEQLAKAEAEWALEEEQELAGSEADE
jgi:hypothetical protein